MTMLVFNKGFTLLEILTVVAILAVLVMLIFPVADRMIASSQRAGCLTNLRAIGGGLHMYAADHNGRLPPLSNSGASGKGKGNQWDAVIMPYLGIASGVEVKTVFFCPASKRFSASKQPLSDNLSYSYNRNVASDTSGSGRLAAIEKPSRLVLVADTDRLPDTNENYLTMEGSSNPIFLNQSTENSVNRMNYKRHRGVINVLFADGSADSRAPVGPPGATTLASKFPKGIQWENRKEITPQ